MRQIEEQLLRPGTLIARPLVAIVGISALCCMTVVVYFSVEAANLEFGSSVTNSNKPAHHMPAAVADYRAVYSWAWYAPIGGLLALTVLVCRRKCTLGGLIAYIALTCLFTTIWLAVTLFAFYLGNQCFWVGAGTL